MGYIPLKLDVASALPPELTAGPGAFISAWVFPPLTPPQGVPTVVALLNGGTYDKRYFHVEIPGRSGYSLAEHLAARGHFVVLLDHLGVGESSRASDQKRVTRQVAALANHAALLQVYEALRWGELDPSLPPVRQFLKIGGGHSMGGMQVITQQAAFGDFDRLLVLGYTAAGVHLTVGGHLVSADPGPVDHTKPDYWLADRHFLRSSFHWEDVPDDVLVVDDALLVEVPNVLSTQSITGGIVTDDASRVEVPVYICLGEHDVSPDPHAEPSFYSASRDITLHILPRSGHCQNFASTRLQMYDRIHRWIAC